ncbi:MAG: hypothetical protein ABIG61_00910 [Planctomycetota bacterium]
MSLDYSTQTCKWLQKRFSSLGLHRPCRVYRYEPGAELTLDVLGTVPANKARVYLKIEKFVGGGFAGQVYQVRIDRIDAPQGPVAGLEAGRLYAMKILVPPGTFARLFRNLIYWLGFQAPFQSQVNPAASRAGALWQKFIRRAASVRFSRDDAVVDIYATFADKTLGSCGEISQWIQGRTWRLEVDDRMNLLKKWRKEKQIDPLSLGSPEYRAKRRFMRDFIKLLCEIGAPEFARQYQWWTCKSQPNVLKYTHTTDNPAAGLVAVDFRPGLALLPFLPMSPADLKLIVTGVLRGSVVQFDRGNLAKLQSFVRSHRAEFADLNDAMNELKTAEDTYRNSQFDITHNHIRLLYCRKLWSTILTGAVKSWQIRNIIDDRWAEKLQKSKLLSLLFLLLAAVPFLGRIVLRLWAHQDWRAHYRSLFSSRAYLIRALHGKVIEKTIIWHRTGRLNPEKATKISAGFAGFLAHLPFSILPPRLHRFLTDFQYFKAVLALLVRPVRLYFNAHMREQWLRDMITEGKQKHILADEDADAIIPRINEPFIQKYLVSLVVHFLTLPVTQIVSFIIAFFFWKMHPQMPPAERAAAATAIIILFQLTPISPGSIVRGLYVLFLVIRERDFKNYNIAVFLGFFKYIGYLAFPIQMAYHYPALARFMAAHWATSAVRIVPVFGEQGALLEHGVFCLFYNWPLTIRRRMTLRAQIRAKTKPRYWHILPAVAGAAVIFGSADFIYHNCSRPLPTLWQIWPLALLAPMTLGIVVTLAARGMPLTGRIISAAAAGLVLALLYTAISAMLGSAERIVATGAWRIFDFTLFAVIAALLTELKLPEPQNLPRNSQSSPFLSADP